MTESTEVLSRKASRRKPPPAEMERMLKVAERAGLISHELKSTVSGELRKTRRRLEDTACSHAWVSNCWESGGDFPPPADTTPMAPCQCERCRRTGKVWPQHYVAERQLIGHSGRFVSYECYLEGLSDWDAARLPSSPSGLALRAIREGRIKLHRQRTYTKSRRFVA